MDHSPTTVKAAAANHSLTTTTVVGSHTEHFDNPEVAIIIPGKQKLVHPHTLHHQAAAAGSSSSTSSPSSHPPAAGTSAAAAAASSASEPYRQMNSPALHVVIPDGPVPPKKAKSVSDAIDRSLRAEKEQLAKERGAKLLILGPSETGKTTVLKQLKLLYGRKGLDAERQSYRRIVHLNAMKAMQALSAALQRSGLPLQHVENSDYLEMVSKLENTLKRYSVTSAGMAANPVYPRKITDAKAETDMFHEMVPAIKALWADGAIQTVFKNGAAQNLQDSAQYFLNQIDRLALPDYIPTDDDIIQARVRTLQVSEHVFNIQGVSYKIYDVGGQKSLRKYWAPYFDDVSAIVFVVALSAYDLPGEDDEHVNRLHEALTLFNSIVNNKLFESTSVILFLNKIDVFEHKLAMNIPVSKYFPEYRGPNDYPHTTLFFQERFMQQCKDTNKQVYVHFTHATDTNQMRVIVVAVNVIVQRLNLRNSGLL